MKETIQDKVRLVEQALLKVTLKQIEVLDLIFLFFYSK
jgi:hypothetical protein